MLTKLFPHHALLTFSYAHVPLLDSCPRGISSHVTESYKYQHCGMGYKSCKSWEKVISGSFQSYYSSCKINKDFISAENNKCVTLNNHKRLGGEVSILVKQKITNCIV